MFQNYLKITLRSLRKHKGYAFINITGLAVGMACCLIIVLFVRDELSTDRFHADADRIYRMVMNIQMGEREIETGAPMALPEALVQETRTVASATGLSYAKRVVVEQEPSLFYESRFFFADAAFFEVFSFDLARGNPATALAEPFSVILAPAMANKYFPNRDAVGETLTLDQHVYTVTGILSTVPANSHLQFNFIASLATQQSLDPDDDPWSPSDVLTYARLAPNATPEAFQADLDQLSETYLSKFDSDRRNLKKEPFTDIYFNSFYAVDKGLRGSMEYLYIFSAIAALILLIACINYMNLATARASRYAKEVGVRKVVGAHRQQLIGRFMSESLFFSVAALLLAIGLVELALPSFNEITRKTLTVPYFDDVLLMVMWLSVGLGTGFLAGSYPAFFLSKFKPASVLKGSLSVGTGRAWLRKGLVVFQFATTVVFFVGTLVVQGQLDHLQTKRLGFNKDQVVVLPAAGPIQEQYATFKAEVQHVPGVRGVASAPMPSPGGLAPVRLEGEPEGSYNFQSSYVVDGDFISLMEIEMVHGRALDANLPSDLEGSVLINEAAMQAFGWTDDPLSHRLDRLGEGLEMVPSQVVGVVRDFNFRSLKNEIKPLIVHLTESRYQNVLVKVDPARIPETLESLQATWATFAPEHPFEYSFLDERFASFYRAEQRLGQIFQYFSFLAILIACLGLFGLATFMAEQRTKEIGVRKVFGASTSSLIVLLSQDFVKLILIAFVLATPIAFILLTHWLDDFPYRIAISSGVFILAGGASLLIALSTVAYQAIRASLANPIDSLRYE